VGIAWKKALAEDPPFVLHRSDKSHPNPTGTYLAACAFYATLLDANPVGLPSKIRQGDKVLADIPDEQAKRLQEIAWAAVKADSRPFARLPFILGADISWVQEQEDQGTRFSDQGQQKDILVILKDHGFNWIRLRVFVNPPAPKGYSSRGYCDLDHTLAMAKRIRAAGMGFLLDFHYSDTWADPGHQVKPAAWADLHGAELEKSVHDHTQTVMEALKTQGTPPDMVQIGNEISNGFLWPDGKVWETKNWAAFCGLIKAGIAGAKEVDPTVRIMIHLAWGGQNRQSRSFLDKALAQGVEFDILGQSYYPKWHGTLDDLKANLTDLAGRYKHDIMLVEYSVPNIRKINDIVYGLPSGRGLGTFIWEPTKWEGPALFDGKGNTRPEIDVYADMSKDYRLPESD
jgi:arabinogalactan endo-1,4-beta-galactosidase